MAYCKQQIDDWSFFDTAELASEDSNNFKIGGLPSDYKPRVYF